MSSASFPSLELHCRPSACLRVAVLVLAGLAGVSVMLSALPVAWLLLVPVLAVLAWRGVGAHAGLVLRFGADGTLRIAPAGTRHGEPARLVSVEERGSLLVVSIRRLPSPPDPQRHPCGSGVSRDKAPRPERPVPDRGSRRSHTMRMCFGPDTAPAAARRALRLWQQRHAAADDDGALATAGLR